MSTLSSILYTTYCDVRAAWVDWDEEHETGSITRWEVVQHRPFRAARLVDNPTRFLFLNFPRRSRSYALHNYLLQASVNGVTVDDTQFTFLGITEAGIKAGQVIFFQEDSKYTVQKLLDKCGGLMDVFIDSGPGKYAARLGLSFSSTIETFKIPREKALMIQDRTASDMTNTTDGGGIIRESAYKRIIKKALPDISISEPSLITQVRWGGIKGILVPYPDEIFNKICMTEDKKSKPGQYVFAYRPSMLKYKGGPTDLEINNYSKNPVRARLNNAFVILLLTLGTKLAPFEKLLKMQVQDIRTIGEDRNKAIHFIDVNLGAQPSDYAQDLLDMLRAGHEMDEPYLKATLRGYQTQQFSQLRTRMNIIVPKSCYIYGVVDELGILKNDEVYINLPDRNGIITGTVLVTRNPAYFPSDMRLLSAVDKYNQLGFLTNCIVFPRGGKTSIPNQMAGGDLDGDTYFICWETSVMPPRTQNPGGSNELLGLKSATSALMAETARRRRAADLPRSLIELFVRMYNSPLLGAASNEWQRVVEHTPQLADGVYPRKLARIVEIALDIAKTGADFGLLEKQFEDIRREYGPRVDMNYPSPLNQLREQVPNLSSISRPISYPVDPDLVLRDGYERVYNEHYQEGLQVIVIFNKRLKEAIEYERRIAEEKPSRRKDRSLSAADKVKKEFQEKYFTPSSGVSEEEDIDNYIRASAWYCIGYERGKIAFAWLGAKYLNKIKSNHVKHARSRSHYHGAEFDSQYGSSRQDKHRNKLEIEDPLRTKLCKLSIPASRESPDSSSRKAYESEGYAESWASETLSNHKAAPFAMKVGPRESAEHSKPYKVVTRKPTEAWKSPWHQDLQPLWKGPEARIPHVHSKLQAPWESRSQKCTTSRYDEYSYSDFEYE